MRGSRLRQSFAGASSSLGRRSLSEGGLFGIMLRRRLGATLIGGAATAGPVMTCEEETMGILTDDMRRVLDEQQLGFIATVTPDGKPNLSPKGTTTAWDDDHLVFADICSPNTIRNLAENGARAGAGIGVLRDGGANAWSIAASSSRSSSSAAAAMLSIKCDSCAAFEIAITSGCRNTHASAICDVVAS